MTDGPPDSTAHPVAPRLPDPVPQRDAGETLSRPRPDEKAGPRRFAVRLHRRGTRLLDVDNGAGGCKALLDAIRYEDLIPNDDPSVIDFYFTQEKVKRPFIGTQITITPL